MCEILKINFGEKCYMSAALLLDQGIYFTTFDFVHKKFNDSLFAINAIDK